MLAKQTSEKSEIFATLQAGRAIASLLVVLFHTGGGIFALEKYWGQDPVHHFFDFGHAGVEFFFVLSGFIIFHIHWSDINQPHRFPSYVRKRFYRIYPIYWMVLAALIPIYFFIPSFGKGFERDPLVIFSSITLLHFNFSDTILPVARTLYHEILFYAIFSLAIWNRKIGLYSFMMWMFASGLSLLFIPPAPLDFYAAPVHLLFAMGMLACALLRSKQIAAPVWIAVFGTILFFLCGMEENYVHRLSGNTRILIFGLGSMLALLGVVELERQKRLRVPKILKLLGDASYMIYLIHFPLLSLLAKVFIRLGAKELLPAIISFILFPIIAAIAGVGLHLFIEKRLLRYLNSWNKKNVSQEEIACSVK